MGQEIVLTERQRRRVVQLFAVLFFALAVGTALFTFLFIGAELKLLRQTPLLPSSGLAVGQPVRFSATIKKANPPLIHDLVVGCEEQQNDDSSWVASREYHRPLAVDRAGAEIRVTLRQPCPRGEHALIPDPKSSMRRWVGFRGGERVTIVGRIAQLEPLSVAAEHYYGGSQEDYIGYLTRVRWYVLPFSAFCLLVGALLLLAGRARRAAK